MSKRPPAGGSQPPTKGGTGGGGEPTRIDVGELSEAVTRSITRALGVQDPARLPIRIIVGLIAEPPDFFRGGGGGGAK